MAFLGVDQSLNATGVCRIDEDGRITASATVDPEGHIDGERLHLIKRAVSTFAADIKFAALEGYSYDSVGRVFELGEIGGVLKVLLLELSIPYVVVPPVLVKKFATGNTSASKDDMVVAAKARGYAFDDDNQADAFFLACIARAFHKDVPRYRCEMEVLRSLRNGPTKKPRRRARRLIKAAV